MMLGAMPVASDYHGRSRGHDLADGTHTRVKIDLFRNMSGICRQRKGSWNVVGRALCSEPVKEAFRRKLAPGLRSASGPIAGAGGPIPILTAIYQATSSRRIRTR